MNTKRVSSCRNWLTLIGPRRNVSRLADGPWENVLAARHVEWLELSPGHYRCEFSTTHRPLRQLQELSGQWPKVTFLLHYERENSMGLIKARRARLTSHEVRY